MQAPNELWTSIFRHAIVQDKHALARLQRVNKRFYSLCQNKRLWYFTFRLQRPRWTQGVEYEHLPDLAWKQRVLQYHERTRAWQDARDQDTDLDYELIYKLKERFGLPANCSKATVQTLVEMLGRSEFDPIHEMIYACNSRMRNLDMDTLRGISTDEATPEDFLTEEMYKCAQWLRIQRIASDHCIISGGIPIPGTCRERAVMLSYPDYRVLLDVELEPNELFCGASLQLQRMLTMTPPADLVIGQHYKEFTIYDMSVQPPRRCHQLVASDALLHTRQWFIAGLSPELVLRGTGFSNGDKTVLMRFDLTTGQYIAIYYHTHTFICSGRYNPNYPMATYTEEAGVCLWSTTNGRLLAQLPEHQADYYLDCSFTSALPDDADISNDGTLTAVSVDSLSPPDMLLITRILDGKTVVDVWDIQWPIDYSERSWQAQLEEDGQCIIDTVPFEESLQLLQQQQLANPASCLQVQLRYSFTPELSHEAHLCLQDSLAVSWATWSPYDDESLTCISDQDSHRVLAQMTMEYAEPYRSEALLKEVVLRIGGRGYFVPLLFKARQHRALQLAREYAKMTVDECRAYLQQRRESSDAAIYEHQLQIDKLIRQKKYKRRKTKR